MTYEQFVSAKIPHEHSAGFEPRLAINSKLFDWQQKLVRS
jgi:hypothetical protein